MKTLAIYGGNAAAEPLKQVKWPRRDRSGVDYILEAIQKIKQNVHELRG